MRNQRLFTATAAALIAGLAAQTATAQSTNSATTEKSAAMATGKASTDGPATTAVQGTARAVQDVAKPAVSQTTTAPPASAVPMTTPVGTIRPVVANGDLLSTLQLSGQFTTFVKALDATNLSGLVQKNPGLTVFAPTDAAFAALPPGKLDALMADKPGLQKLLLHHIVNAKIDSSKIKGARGGIQTGAGDKVVIDGSTDQLKADNANIIQADVMATNGTLHVVDAVLMVGSVPETLPQAASPAETTPSATPAPVKKTAARKKK